MASLRLLNSSSRPELYVCTQCAFRASRAPARVTKRFLGTKYMTKVANAEHEWKLRAGEIKAGKHKTMLSILEERGLVKDLTMPRDLFEQQLTENRIGAYVGIDPTAASLHLGNIVPLMALFWLYIKGYHVVSLLGGATAKIGDPTNRLKTREKEPTAMKVANMTSMHYQLKGIWMNVEAHFRTYGYQKEWVHHRELVNNNFWWNKVTLLEILQVLGPGLRMGTMLAHDTVKTKMTKGDGMSYAEFSYPVMQSWDWWHMFNTKGVSMQIGGSDQFGNIIAGIDAIKFIKTHHADPDVRNLASAVGEPIGMTVPLLTTSSGAKFGKSAGNAVWLDGKGTSLFDLYGYFVRMPDADVGKYLKLLTFMPIEDIDALVKEHMENPQERKAQHKLAYEFVAMIHGPFQARQVQEQHRQFLGKAPIPTIPVGGSGVDVSEVPDIRRSNNNTNKLSPYTSNVTLPKSVIYQKSMAKILLAAQFAQSVTEAHRSIIGGAIYIGSTGNEGAAPMPEGYVSWKPVKTWDIAETRKFLLNDELLLLRKGKQDVKIIQVVSDEDFVMSGLTYKGMSWQWKKAVLERMSEDEAVTAKEKEAIRNILDDEAAAKGLLGESAEGVEVDEKE